MASGTIMYSEANSNASAIAWSRIDQGGAYVSGLIEHGEAALAYMPSTTAPGIAPAPDVLGVLTLQERDPFSFAMGTGESLWIKLMPNAGTQVSVIVRNA